MMRSARGRQRERSAAARRASDYLSRRGFGRDEIRAAIARYQDNFEEC